MDRETVLPARTVLVADGKIVAINAADAPTPDCTRTKDGSGLFLAPGLNDMHVHVETKAFGEIFGIPDIDIRFEDVLFPYLAAGVTGVRVMSGSPDLLAYRASPHGPSPRLMIASPMLSGEPPILPEPATRVVTEPAKARTIVAEYAAQGYDLVKIRGNLDREVLNAVFEAAARYRLPVDGHIPNIEDWSLEDLGPGKQIGVAHLDEFALNMDDEADAVRYARRVRDCGCYATTTMSVEKSAAAQLRDYDAVAARPEMRFVHPLLRDAFWTRERNPYLAESPPPAFFDRLLAFDQALVRAFKQEGARLLAGSDSLSPMIIPGFSLHEELRLLVDAGLTPYQALKMATQAPAEIFPQFADVGVLRQGAAANAVLLHSNPLADIGAVSEIEGVIVQGRFFDRGEIDARLDEIALSYAK